MERENQELKARLARYDDTRPIDGSFKDSAYHVESGEDGETMLYRWGDDDDVFLELVLSDRVESLYLCDGADAINLTSHIRTKGRLAALLFYALGIGGGGDSAGKGGE